MKKFRFFSVAVAVVTALFVSVWAQTTGSYTYNMTTLNGFAPGETSKSCLNLPGPSASYLYQVIVKGKLSSSCSPATGQIRLYQLNGAQQTLIGSVNVPVSSTTSFSNATITLPHPKYPANGSYCIAAYVTGCSGAISLTSGSAVFYWKP